MSRLRYIKGSEEVVAASLRVIHKAAERYFENDNPLRIEVGMGKGRFITKTAEENPDINFIGVERYESVMLRALQKQDALEKEGKSPENLLFLCEDALNLGEYFPEKSLDMIYLNFSDPWPKDRHAHRRLVSEAFLKRFHSLLKDGACIEFKTDNVGLFDYALTQYEAAGYSLKAMTRDLHGDPELGAGNIMTEYEEKFSLKGNKICKLILKKEDN